MKMLSSTVSADKVFPVAGVFDDVVVSRRGALTLGWELTMPVMYSCNEDDYDEIVEAFASAMKVLPAWSVIHRQDFYRYEDYVPEGDGLPTGHVLEDAFREHFRGRKYLSHKSYLFISIAPRLAVDKPGSSSGIFGIQGSVDVPSPSQFAAFRSKCSEFFAILMNNGRISARILRERDWIGEGDEVGIIQRYMMMGDGSPIMSDIRLAPDAVSVHGQVMQAFAVGESDYLPGEIATVDSVPALSSLQNTVWLSFAAKVGVLLDCDHVVNQYFVVPNQDELKRQLDAERKRMYSGIKSVDNRLNGAEIGDFLEAAYKSGLFAVYTHTNVLAWSPEEDSQRVSGMLAAAFRSMNGITAKYNTFNTPVLYYAGIPSNAFELGRENWMTMELYSALCLSPYETFERGIPGGHLHLCDRVRHIPVDLDTQNVAQEAGFITNYNMFILGGSGTGKSFFTNKLVKDMYCAGQAVFIIDVGDSYEGQCAVVNEESGGKDGVYMSWDDDHPITFNAFEGAEDWLSEDGTLRSDEENGNFFQTLLQTVFSPDGGWTAERKSVLVQTIVDYLKHCRTSGETPLFDGYFHYFEDKILPKMIFVSTWEKTAPTVGDEKSAERIRLLKEDDYRSHGYWAGNVPVTKELFDAAKFVLSMKEYATSGTHGALLNDPSPKDVFSSDMTVVEVDKLSQADEKFYSICILCIMHALDVKMRKDTGKFKTIIIEEAWKAISNETMAPYLRGLWKTARKFNTSACVVTQEVGDIIDNPTIKTAILDNSEVKILLDQSNHLNTFGALQKVLSLTDKDANLILSMNRNNDPDLPMYKEVFLSLGGKKSGVYATEVSRIEAMAYESNKKKKQPLLRRAAELGSMVDALRSMAEEQNEEQQIEETLGKMRPTRRLSLLKKLLKRMETVYPQN